MLALLRTVALDVVVCLSQLFDFYLYTVYSLFAPPVRTDATRQWHGPAVCTRYTAAREARATSGARLSGRGARFLGLCTGSDQHGSSPVPKTPPCADPLVRNQTTHYGCYAQKALRLGS